MKRSIIIICLEGDRSVRQYIQATRKRFKTYKDAQEYACGIDSSRQTVVIAVPAVECDEDGYPIWDDDSFVF